MGRHSCSMGCSGKVSSRPNGHRAANPAHVVQHSQMLPTGTSHLLMSGLGLSTGLGLSRLGLYSGLSNSQSELGPKPGCAAAVDSSSSSVASTADPGAHDGGTASLINMSLRRRHALGRQLSAAAARRRRHDQQRHRTGGGGGRQQPAVPPSWQLRAPRFLVLCVSQARYATVKSVSSQWAALPNSCRNGHCRSNPAPVILQGPLVFAKQALFGGQLY